MPLKKKSLLSWTFCLGGEKRRKYTVSVKLTVTFRAAAPECRFQLYRRAGNCRSLGSQFWCDMFCLLASFFKNGKVYKIKNSQHGVIRSKGTLSQVLGPADNLQNPHGGSREPMLADVPLLATHCAMVRGHTHIQAYICTRINKC